ncbi:unnamed protein product, partial [Owenia fusiformis]
MLMVNWTSDCSAIKPIYKERFAKLTVGRYSNMGVTPDDSFEQETKTDILILDDHQHKESTDAKSKDIETKHPLERETVSIWLMVMYCTLYVALETGKHVSTYGAKYYNDGVYPMRQTLMVSVTEIMKLVAVLCKLIYDGNHNNMKLSIMFAIPSLIYAINNNISYYAFHFTTPAIWNVLSQFRIVLTALVYRVIFKRSVTKTQWMAIHILLSGIFIVAFTSTEPIDLHVQERRLLNPFVFVLSFILCSLSVVGSIYMEYLFKNDRRPFIEQQCQLYMFTGAVATLFFALDSSKVEALHQINGTGSVPLASQLCFMASIILGTILGLTVAVIVKKLDNIVKIYSQTLANIFTTMLCASFFPNDVTITPVFIVALGLIFV